MDAHRIFEILLPQPKRVCIDGGTCSTARAWQGDVHVDDPRLHRAAAKIAERLSQRPEHRIESASIPDAAIRIEIERALQPQGYRMTVAAHRIVVAGGSAAGCFHGLQTLAQLVGASRTAGVLSCCTIEDEPDFATRGFLHDITRGKVPTIPTLKHLADRLASWKINQLQLYIEHAFVFSFDPDICDDCDGLTAEEVHELDAYCRERFIDLVPAVATFGHMGRILSMSRYRHLAEVETTKTWAETPWPARARGLTLDCTAPEAHRLVERIWGDVLDAFSGSVVNICGDEPWDLGRGRNRVQLEGRRGETYLHHIRRTHEFCRSRHRRTQVWSDVIRSYPELLDRVPYDATVLHWGYDDSADYDATRSLVDAGLNVYACPGTSGWKRIINAMNAAEDNIRTFAQVGKQCGATGLINTDWGDHGHFNMLACSWHAVALGAALGWTAEHPTGAAFDNAFTHHVLTTDAVHVVTALRAASAIATTFETWKLLWTPIASMDLSGLPPMTAMDDALHAAREAEQSLDRLTGECSADRDTDLRELKLACRFLTPFVAKIALAHQRDTPGTAKSTPAEGSDSDRYGIHDLADDYARLWTRRNKPSGLSDVLATLERIAVELREGRAR